MAGNIFINYRRGDEPAAAGRLFDHLERAFPPQRLFLDVDSIAPGLDFVKELEVKVAACDVLLAVIGQNWVDARDAKGTLRLHDPKDFVRIEIAAALKQDKRVIPVLINDAAMPRDEELPEPLKPLAVRNAVRLTHERFRSDAQGLVKAIEAAIQEANAASEKAKAEALAHRAEQAERVERERVRLRATPGLSRDDIAKAEELANWDFIKASATADDFRDHLARFPEGVTQRMARTRLEGLVWQGLGPSPDARTLGGFLTEFPEGANAAAARARLELPAGNVTTRLSVDRALRRAPVGSPRGPSTSRRSILVVGGGAAAAGLGALFFLKPQAPRPEGPKPKLKVADGGPPPKPPRVVPETPLEAPKTRLLASMDVGNPVASLSLAREPQFALVGPDAQGLQLWDLSGRRRVAAFGQSPKAIHAVACSADGQSAVTAGTDESLSLWDLSGARSGAVRLVRGFRPWSGDAVLSLALSPDAKSVLCGSTAGTVEVWQTADGTLARRFVGQSDAILSVACAGDGHSALSASRDTTIMLWDYVTGRSMLELRGHAGPVRSVAFSPDNAFALSGGDDRTVRLWDLYTGTLVRTFSGHAGGVAAVTFLPNGRHCLSGAADGALRLWDVHNGRPVFVFDDRPAELTGVAARADGKAALSSTSDGKLKLWNVAGLCHGA